MTGPDQDGAAPSHTHIYQWRQTITFQECAHDDSRPSLPSTQQLSVDSVFVLYNEEERILRYALSNSIGPVRGKEEGAHAGWPITVRSHMSLCSQYLDLPITASWVWDFSLLFSVYRRKRWSDIP